MRDPGAPFDLCRILEPAGEPELIHQEAPEDATILDLGCGTGRITHALIKLGHRVTAVDFDERMLDEIEGAETVLSRIEDLDLGRTFGVVLLMSTLINRPDQTGRLALLAACRRHVAPNGVVLIERYDPEIGVDPRPTEREFAGITIRVTDVRREGPLISQSVEYDGGDRGKWRIRIDGRYVLNDDETLADLAAAGLRLRHWIDDRHRWLAATVA
ncbi:MAG: class I SAM-dependent methyltransferase [Chloroflexi bacterium]|nr:MAG: class I SAM-dependent methyltransferase [Chloroflexota bacterium]